MKKQMLSILEGNKTMSLLQNAPLPSSRSVGVRDIRGAIRHFAAPIFRTETLRNDEARSGGFTLIELLVVVLIIGILAAVALPQYQKAVVKSRYATLKNLTHSIAQAQEIYYLANGKYATDFEELSIEMPAGKLDTSTAKNYKYDWGRCYLAGVQVMCSNSKIQMQYQMYLQNSLYPGLRECVSTNVQLSSVQSAVCKSEVENQPVQSQTDSYIIWSYPH